MISASVIRRRRRLAKTWDLRSAARIPSPPPPRAKYRARHLPRNNRGGKSVHPLMQNPLYGVWAKGRRRGRLKLCLNAAYINNELGLCRRRHGLMEPRQFHRKPLLAPLARRSVKHTGALCPAREALALAGQSPAAERVPIAFNEASAALMTKRALASDIVNIADIGVANTLLHGDAARHGQRRLRRAWIIEHAIIGMEGREMQRHVRT